MFRKQVDQSKNEAAKDGVKVPETVEEYCVKAAPQKAHDDVDMLDFDDDDYYDYGADSDGDDYEEDHDEDSGQGES